MSSREKVKSIRPSIPSLTEHHRSSELEQFQNRSLRPILKFQNDLLISLFKDYIQQRKVKYFALPPREQAQFIADSIKKDQKFKHLLIGTLIGHFTAEEYHFYQLHKSELNRRMGTLLIQRIQDQLLDS